MPNVRTRRDAARAYFELTKPRIALLVLAVAVATHVVAARGRADTRGLGATVASVYPLAAGIFALNHWLERDRDRLMRRTRGRPLPEGRLDPRVALVFGLGLTALGLVLALLTSGWVTALVGLATAVLYVPLYTPLKYRTRWHTFVGALSGATPPLMGWAAATGSMSAQAWALAAMVFLWQFPHLVSIEVMYREDYARAGVRLLSPGAEDRAAATVTLAANVALVGVSLLPWLTGLAGWLYAACAGAAGLAFLLVGARTFLGRRRVGARHLLRASVVYLPFVWLLLVVGA